MSGIRRKRAERRGRPGRPTDELAEIVDPRQNLWEPALLAEARRLSDRRPRLSGGARGEAFGGAEADSAAADLLELQRGLTGDRRLVATGYMDERRRLSSYLLFYWPVSYAQVRGILDQAKTSIDAKMFAADKIRILDVGAGPSPGGLAAADWHNAEAGRLRKTDATARAVPPVIEIVALDRSGLALESARRLAAAAGYAFSGRSDWFAGRDPPPDGTFDYIILGHVLNEIAAEETERNDRMAARTVFLRSLRPRLRDGGLLIIVEPALLESSRDAIFLRDALTADNWYTLAPCLHNHRCPALVQDGQTCHSDFRWQSPSTVRELAARTGLDKAAAKATAFVLTPQASPATPPINQAASSGEPGGSPHRADECFRVVSDPLLNKAGRVRLLICGEMGRLPLSMKRGEKLPAATVFAALRRSDLIRLSAPVKRENGLALGPDTVITVDDPSGR